MCSSSHSDADLNRSVAPKQLSEPQMYMQNRVAAENEATARRLRIARARGEQLGTYDPRPYNGKTKLGA